MEDLATLSEIPLVHVSLSGGVDRLNQVLPRLPKSIQSLHVECKDATNQWYAEEVDPLTPISGAQFRDLTQLSILCDGKG